MELFVAIIGVVLEATVRPYLSRDVDLQWYSTFKDITGYTVQYWREDQVQIYVVRVFGQRNFYRVSDLSQGQQYSFRIRAELNNGSNSSWSNVATSMIKGDKMHNVLRERELKLYINVFRCQ